MSLSSPDSGLNLRQFEQLYKSHFLHLCNFADQYVADSDISKDVVQKVFITLWERRNQMDLNQSIKSYLFTAVKNRCLNYIRDHKKYRSRTLDLDCGDIEVATQDGSIEMEELQDQIDKALDTLPEKCRIVFEMSRFQDMKYKAIAQKLSISEKTVEAHMSKALRTLRLSLSKYLLLLLIIILIIIKSGSY